MPRGSELTGLLLMIGKVPPDEQMLKEISSLLYRLPAASSPEFTKENEESWGGVLLAGLFTEILKGSGDIQDVLSLFHPPNARLLRRSVLLQIQDGRDWAWRVEWLEEEEA